MNPSISLSLTSITATSKVLNVSLCLGRIDQFNNSAFCSDLTLFTQSGAGMQQLQNVIKQFERWSGIKVSLQKTVMMVVLGDHIEVVKLNHRVHNVPRADDKEAIRNLGFWSTRKGDMSKTKEKVFESAKLSRELIRLHPITPKCAVEVYLSKGTGLFRYSAALVEWS